MTTQLTPAELGYLAATLDDAQSQGLGDDDIAEALVNTLAFHNIAHDQKAWDLAYDFMRGHLNG